MKMALNNRSRFPFSSTFQLFFQVLADFSSLFRWRQMTKFSSYSLPVVLMLGGNLAACKNLWKLGYTIFPTVSRSRVRVQCPDYRRVLLAQLVLRSAITLEPLT